MKLQELYQNIQADFKLYADRMPANERKRIAEEISKLETMANTMLVSLQQTEINQEQAPQIDIFSQISQLIHELTAYRSQANFVISQLLAPDADGFYLLKENHIELFKYCFVLWQKVVDLVQKITDINAASGQNWVEYFTDDYAVALVKNFKIDEQTMLTFAKELRLYANAVHRWLPVYKAILSKKFMIEKEKVIAVPEVFVNEFSVLLEKTCASIVTILGKYEGLGYILQSDYVDLLDFQAKFAIIENSLPTLLLQKKDYSKTKGYKLLKEINNFIPIFLQTHIVETPIQFEDRIESSQIIPADTPADWKILEDTISITNGYRSYKIQNSNGDFWILEEPLDSGDDIIVQYYFSNSLGKWQKFHAAEPRKIMDDLKVIGQTTLETGGMVLAGGVLVASDVFFTKGSMLKGFLGRFITHIAVQRFFLAVQGTKNEKLDTWENIDIGDAIIQSVNYSGIKARWFKGDLEILMQIIVPSVLDINANCAIYTPCEFSIWGIQKKTLGHIGVDLGFNTIGFGINKFFDGAKGESCGSHFNDKTGKMEIDPLPYATMYVSNIIGEGLAGSNGLGSVIKNLILIPEENETTNTPASDGLNNTVPDTLNTSPDTLNTDKH